MAGFFADEGGDPADFGGGFVGGDRRHPAAEGQHRGKELLDPPGERRAATDLGELGHLAHQRGQRRQIADALDLPAEREKERAQRRLRDITRPVESRGTGARRRQDAERRPQRAPIELQTLHRRRVNAVEQHDLGGRGYDDPPGGERAVDDRRGMQRRQRRQRLQQEAQGGVDPEPGTIIALPGLDDVDQPLPRHQLGDDHQPERGAFNGPDPHEPLIVERRDRVRLLAQARLERPELGAQVQAFEHAPDFAVEPDGPPSEAVLVAGGRDRDGASLWQSRHGDGAYSGLQRTNHSAAPRSIYGFRPDSDGFELSPGNGPVPA